MHSVGVGKKRNKSITPQQARFVDEYLIDLSATHAAIRAGYSKKSAMSLGCQLLQNPKVATAISARQKKLSDKLEITAARVLKENARIAFSDTSRVASWGPGGVVPIDSKTLSENDRRAIAEVSHTVNANGISVRVKMHSKQQALDALARHLGLFDELSKQTRQRPGASEFVNLGPDEGETPENYPDDYGDEPTTEH